MKRLTLILLSFCSILSTHAQQKGVSLSGSVQSDMLLPQSDEKIGAEKKEDFVTNTYADLQLQSQYVECRSTS